MAPWIFILDFIFFFLAPLEQVIRRWFEAANNLKKKAQIKATNPRVCKPYQGGHVPPNIPFCNID